MKGDKHPKHNLRGKRYAEVFGELFHDQKGCCAICGLHHSKIGRNVVHRELKLTEKLFIDHCHETGRIRGLLCNNCNSILGVLENNGWPVFTDAELQAGKVRWYWDGLKEWVFRHMDIIDLYLTQE